MSEVAILTCSRTEDKRLFLHHFLSLPSSPLLERTASKFIADTAFAPNRTRIATITDQGNWMVCDLSIKRKEASVVATGKIELTSYPDGESRTEWWKMEWTRSSNALVVAENKAVHYLNIHVSISYLSSLIKSGSTVPVITGEKNVHFRGIAKLDALSGTTMAVLTTSEILIMEIEGRRILLRQKHRRDPDPSLVMKVISCEDGTLLDRKS